jgi:hypothetical protein
MNFKDIPLEKLWSFIAALIPGGAAMLIFQMSHRNAFSWYYSATLGYKTKLFLLFLVAFVVGNTVTAAVSFFAGAFGGVVGALRGYKSSVEYTVAPWRDARWRNLVVKRLGSDWAPQDIPWISDEIFAIKQQFIGFMPEEQRADALNQLVTARMQSVANDMEWRHWYEYFKQIVTQLVEDPFTWHVRTGLFSNLQAAALCVLISAIFVPPLRHWWYLLPSGFWLLSIVAEVFAVFRKQFDPWSGLTDQINYLALRG